MEEQSVTVRKMELFDIDDVEQVEIACFSTPWSKKSLEEALQYDTHQFLVAEVDGKVVGYMGLIKMFTEADVTNIAVLPDIRRRGIATALLEETLKLARKSGVEVVFLEVRQSNTCAIHLYEKYQFKAISIRKNYYQNPTEHAVVMSADLSTRKKE